MIAHKNGKAKLHIPKEEMVEEHERLVNVMRRGSKRNLSREAKHQAKELRQYKSAKLVKGR
jgi:hypothetical protein